MDLGEVPDYRLVSEMRRRGWTVTHVGKVVVPDAPADPPSEETDLDKWLKVWGQLDYAHDAAIADGDALGSLLTAVRNLVTLIQPPSARVARQISAAAEASSQT